MIRLVVSREAYEPERGAYRADYLAAMVDIAQAASRRGLYVIVDIHQDGFARNLAGGCGDGVPTVGDLRAGGARPAGQRARLRGLGGEDGARS